jgi:hypothetical protein
LVIANDDRSHNGRYRGNRQDRIHCVIQSVCRAIAHNRFDSSRIPRMPCKWGCGDQRTSLRCAHFRRCPTDRQPYPGSTIWTGDRGKSIVAAHRGGERHAAGAAAPDFTASRRRTHRQLEFLPRRAPDARASLYARSGRRLRPRRPAREELEGKAWTPGATGSDASCSPRRNQFGQRATGNRFTDPPTTPGVGQPMMQPFSCRN